MPSELSTVTIVIPTHNRHGYLKRSIEFYSKKGINVIIVDSTLQTYPENLRNTSIDYYHLPGMPMPQKLSFAMDKVGSKFVVFCADDDFILLSSVETCIKFLNSNSDFTSAQGNSITYKKNRKYKWGIEFNPLYDIPELEISSSNAFDRLSKLFHPYRTIFSAVHYTKIMREAYRDIDPGVKNLFLNEYITAIIPIINGKHIELPLLYQVRESAEDSGDKTTENLDVIFQSHSYDSEREIFLDYLAKKISGVLCINILESKNNLTAILLSFAKELQSLKKNVRPIVSKKLGKYVAKVPIIGEYIVMKRRLRLQNKKLIQNIRSSTELHELENIKRIIIKYAERV